MANLVNYACDNCGEIGDQPFMQHLYWYETDIYLCQKCVDQRVGDAGKLECWMCGEMFVPDPEKVKAWAESDRPFDGTDWECPDCIKGQEPDDRDVDDDSEGDYNYGLGYEG